MKYRSSTEIIDSVLRSAGKEGATRTRIGYGACLSYAQLKEYLSKMVSQDLLSYENETHLYKLTQGGEKCMEKFSADRSLVAFPSPPMGYEGSENLTREKVFLENRLLKCADQGFSVLGQAGKAALLANIKTRHNLTLRKLVRNPRKMEAILREELGDAVSTLVMERIVDGMTSKLPAREPYGLDHRSEPVQLKIENTI
jgi:predicted transcriptional regulator